MDLEAVISNAVADFKGGDGDGGADGSSASDVVETSGDAGTSDTGGAADGTAGSASVAADGAGQAGGSGVGEGSGPDAVRDGAAADPAAVQPKPEDKKPADPDDLSAIPEKITQFGKERENRIPYSAVKRIVGNAEKRAVETALKEPTEKLKTYEARLSNIDNLGKIAETDPDRFIAILAKNNKAYEKYLQPAAVQPAVPAKPTDLNEPMPQPDVELADGTRSYSLEGLQKWGEWRDRQTEARLDAKFGKRVEPFERAEAGRKALAESAQRIEAQLKEARQWPGFTDHEKAIGEYLVQNPKHSLDAAYRAVVIPKFRSDRDAMRADILKELEKRATSTAVQPKTPVVPKEVEETDPDARIEAVIRNSIKGKAA